MLRVLIHFTHLPEPAVLSHGGFKHLGRRPCQTTRPATDQPLSDFPSFTIAITSATAAIVN
jgi:hypothetical protein